MPRPGVSEQTALVRRNADAVAASLLSAEALPPPSGRRVLVVLMGLPASGKSHAARSLATRLGAVVVSSDALRRRLFVAPSYARDETEAVFAVAHAQARSLLERDHTAIFDATNLRERDRDPLYALARDAAAAVVLVRLSAPEDLVRERLAGRLAGVSDADQSDADLRVYEMMRERYEPPLQPVVEIDAGADLERELERVVEAVRLACA